MGQVWISGEILISHNRLPVTGTLHSKTTPPGTLRDVPQQQPPGDLPSTAWQQVLVRANITLYEPRGDYQ